MIEDCDNTTKKWLLELKNQEYKTKDVQTIIRFYNIDVLGC